MNTVDNRQYFFIQTIESDTSLATMSDRRLSKKVLNHGQFAAAISWSFLIKAVPRGPILRMMSTTKEANLRLSSIVQGNAACVY